MMDDLRGAIGAAILDAVADGLIVDARTYLAGQALSGLVRLHGPLCKSNANNAVTAADALLAELAKPKDTP